MNNALRAPEETQDEASLSHRPLWPVRNFLICLVLACLIPGLIGAALLTYHDYQTGRVALERNSLLTTRAFMQAVDSHLSKVQAVAQSLSASNELRHGNFEGLYHEARALLVLNGLASAFSLSDETAQLRFNTSRKIGQALPKHGNPEQIRRVFETGQPSISNLFMGNVSRQFVVSLDVPVVVDGKVAYVLTAVLRPEIFNTFLQSQQLPKDWIAGVFDSEGTFVARTLAPENFIGKKPSAELLRRAKETDEGVFESVTPDGIPVLTIFSRSPTTGWFVALGIPRKVLEAEYLRPLWLLVAGMVLLFGTGLGLAWWISERIADSARALAKQAKLLGMGKPVVLPPVYIKESHEVANALIDAALLLTARAEALDHERKGREAQLEHLVAERTAALQAAIQEAEHLARCDPLTGLHNRRSANERLREEFLRMKRSGTQYAVLLSDIDHFKRINDTHGHETGDDVLREVSNILNAGIRATDFVFRFGGEEFLIVLPNTGADGAMTLAEKIRTAVSETNFPDTDQITISIGISCTTANDLSEGDAVRRADAALYSAKGEGRNRTHMR